MELYDGDITWEELENRLPAVLKAINEEQGTKYKYDPGLIFYRCLFCNWDLNKHKYTANAEVDCCEEQMNMRSAGLKERAVLYDGNHTSAGKPKKFSTLPQKVCIDT